MTKTRQSVPNPDVTSPLVGGGKTKRCDFVLTTAGTMKPLYLKISHATQPRFAPAVTINHVRKAIPTQTKITLDKTTRTAQNPPTAM